MQLSPLEIPISNIRDLFIIFSLYEFSVTPRPSYPEIGCLQCSRYWMIGFIHSVISWVFITSSSSILGLVNSSIISSSWNILLVSDAAFPSESASEFSLLGIYSKSHCPSSCSSFFRSCFAFYTYRMMFGSFTLVCAFHLINH